MKILIMVICCDNELYNDLENTIRETWGKDINKDVQIVYYYNKEDIVESFMIGDRLYINGKESLFNIGQKTLGAFDYVVKNIEFDYIFRTNLSSYVNINELLDFIKDKQKNDYCSAVVGLHNGIEFPSGCGYFLSRNLIYKILENKDKWDNSFLDDVSLGILLKSIGVNIQRDFKRIDISDDNDTEKIKNTCYHYRCKNEFNREIDKRIFKKLYNIHKNNKNLK